MTIESNTGLNVDAIYGQRDLGGYNGYKKTSGITYEVAINFGNSQKPQGVTVPAGAIITTIEDDMATGTVGSATVGPVDVISALSDTKVAVPLGGELLVDGPTAGTVIVQYIYTV